MAKKISESELQQFRAFDPTLKANVMEAYLIRGMKMNEVAKLFLNSNYSFAVSLIHRCYNFSDKNSGRYSANSHFVRKYGYRVTKRDIEEFINMYPDGTFKQGITFDDFLLKKIARMKKANHNQNINTHTQYQPSKQYPQDSFFANEGTFETNYAGNQAGNQQNYSNTDTGDGIEFIFVIVAGIITIALLYFLVKFLWKIFLKAIPSLLSYAVVIVVVGAIIKSIYNRFKYH
jgi:hypothetical protein